MYADRNAGPGGFHPGSLAVALAVNVAVIGALFFAAPMVSPFKPAVEKPPLVTYPVDPPTPVPPPPEPALRRQPDPIAKPDAPKPIVDSKPISDSFPVVNPLPYAPSAGDGDATGNGTGGVVVDPPRPAPPVIVEPGIDPRYADAFQPVYPSEERRAEREGRVVVRVLIGTDGRVKQVEPVNAASDAFFRATRDRALSKWRFKPGTRDGVAVEAWRTMSVSFVLKNEY